VPLFRTELTTVLTTTMTTFSLPDTLNYATVEFTSYLVTPSARAYGSEGYGSNHDQIPLSDSLLFGTRSGRPARFALCGLVAKRKASLLLDRRPVGADRAVGAPPRKTGGRPAMHLQRRIVGWDRSAC